MALSLSENKSLLLWTQVHDQFNRMSPNSIVEWEYIAGIKEKRYRYFDRFFGAVPFENLIAMKALWIDDRQYNRDIINMAKFQTIVIIEVNERERSAKEISNLSKITEAKFSSWRIDSFFFIDRHTLAVIMNGRLLMVDWKKVEIKRCIKLVGLPEMKEGDDWFRTSLIYWYDTNNEMVLFRAGVIERKFREDWQIYNSSPSFFKTNYIVSGYFSLHNKSKNQAIDRRDTSFFSEPEPEEQTSRILMSDQTIESIEPRKTEF